MGGTRSFYCNLIALLAFGVYFDRSRAVVNIGLNDDEDGLAGKPCIQQSIGISSLC